MKVSSDFLKGVDTRPLSSADYKAAGNKFKVAAAKIRAVVDVEAAGRGFWNSGNMKMLYEGHIAYRETKDDPVLRRKLVKAGVAWRRWGDRKYGKAGVSIQRLRTALEIAGPVAFRWASYGLPQKMGFNAEASGYRSAQHMFDEFRKGEPEQLEGMFLFIKVNNLISALQKNDWHAFARRYNGSGYATHGYHTRLANAYAKHSKSPQVAPDPMADGVLRRGEIGDVIADLQTLLNVKFDAELEVDGHFGRATEAAVRDAQRRLGLSDDGLAGPQTLAALNSYVPPEPQEVEQALRESGSRTIKEADRVDQVTNLAVGGGILTALGQYFADFRALLSELPDWLVPIVIIAVLFGIWWHMRTRSKRIRAARVDDQIQGKHIGRVVVEDDL